MKKQFKLKELIPCESKGDCGCIEPYRIRVMNREKALKLFHFNLEDIEWMRDNFQRSMDEIYKEMFGFIPEDTEKSPVCVQIFHYRKELRELWLAEKNALNKLTLRE